MERLGARLADLCERWFPDAFVFAALAVALVCVAALGVGRAPAQIAVDFGASLWSLVPFTMQMAFVVIGGYVVAVSPPVRRLIDRLARVPKTPKSAVAYVALVAMLASLLSWGFSMIFAGILMKRICRRVPGVDYRAVGAAGYLGLGSVWALGLSSSAALLMATKASIPKELHAVSGTIPLSATLFTWQNGVLIAALVVLSVWIAYVSAPTAERARTAEMAGLSLDDEPVEDEPPSTSLRPAERLERSPILTWLLVALAAGYLVHIFRARGGLAALDLDTYNVIFLFTGMLVHRTPRSFLRAAARAVPMTGGVLIQFPLYAGIFGVMMGAGLAERMAHFFVSISTKDTLPLVGGVYSAVLGLFLPSGGGKWVVEAPYLLGAANDLHTNLAWMVQVYNAAEALPNFVNPFWMLPLMGLTGVRARDLAGYSTLQLLFHLPVVLLLLWWLGMTMPYVPPSP